METIITIIGTLITVISFIYAIHRNRKLKKLEDYNREQAWELYRQSAKVLCLSQELEQIPTNDKNTITTTAKNEAASQELILSAIRMIKRFEPKYDIETIESWTKLGRLANESHIKAFKAYIEK